MSITARRTAKDSVFRDFFGRKENLLKLYQTLHPEDTQVTQDMLDNITIENVLTDQMYNDLGFTVRDKLMILVEAQSTWSVNIIVRALLYMAQSYQERFKNLQINLYSSKKIELPEPELYVIYTGERRNHPDTLMMSEEFFNGRQTSIEVKVRVLYGEEKTDIIGQYVRFCKVFNSQIAEHGLTEEAIRETIRICKDEDVLKAYLEEREKEVTTIMMALFDEEYIRNAYGKEKFDEGKAEGMAVGKAEGMDKQAQTTALNLHAHGMTNSFIAQMIGYTENVVAAWIAKAQA